MESDPYDLFIAAVKSEATKKAYRWALDRYLEFCKADSYADLLTGENGEIEDRFHKFILSQNADHVSNSMRNLMFSAVKLFYIMNQKELKFSWLGKLKKHNDEYREDKPYSKDDIEKMLEAAGKDDRAKAIILLFATSGMRLGGLAGVRLRDIALQDPDKVLAIRVYPQTKEQYLTFATTQTYRHVIRYLKERFKRLDDLPKDAPLIAYPGLSDMPAGIDNIGNTIRDLAIKAGLRPEHADPRTRHAVMRVHGFRKFFASTMAGIADIQREHRERLLGHITGLDRSYVKMDIQELLPQYRKAIPALTFQNASQPLG